jgi:hypothetical protein
VPDHDNVIGGGLSNRRQPNNPERRNQGRNENGDNAADAHELPRSVDVADASEARKILPKMTFFWLVSSIC